MHQTNYHSMSDLPSITHKKILKIFYYDNDNDNDNDDDDNDDNDYDYNDNDYDYDNDYYEHHILE